MLIKYQKAKELTACEKLTNWSKAFFILSLLCRISEENIPANSSLKFADLRYFNFNRLKLYPITFALGRSHECELQKAH